MTDPATCKPIARRDFSLPPTAASAAWSVPRHLPRPLSSALGHCLPIGIEIVGACVRDARDPSPGAEVPAAQRTSTYPSDLLATVGRLLSSAFRDAASS
jgi:hypothetical protein